MLLGKNLHPDDQRHVLSAFIYRFTQTHVPEWAKSGNYTYYPQFKDDDDWLANTLFHVRNDERLDRRYKSCQSSPTWPLGKGINGQKGVD
jgi:hypothetical protein